MFMGDVEFLYDYVYRIRYMRWLYGRCVAAPDGLKSETFCRDLKILHNPAAERPVATASATVHILSVSDAQDRSLKPREALERR